MKKVLIIAYIFPPIGGSGVQRTLKFTRYLPQFGWQPIVVCGDNGDVYNFGYDSSLVSEIPPEATINRTRFRSPLALRLWIQNRLGIKRRKYPASKPTSAQTSKAEVDGRAFSRLMKAFNWLSALLAPFEFPPIDAVLYWAISIVPMCLKIIRKEDVDVIFTTSFPYSDHVAGYLLKRLTGKPWVAEFRDPWTKNASARNHGWRFRCDVWMERQILKHADRVIAVTPSYTRDFQSLAPNHSAVFKTITNGYDCDDFTNLPDVQASSSMNGKTVITHTGKVYNGTAVPFLKALRALSVQDLAQLHVRFVGGLSPDEKSLQDKFVGSPIEVQERVNHINAINEMRQADVLLLPIGMGDSWLGHYPGKLFEYIVSGTPILLVGPDGDAADLVRKSGTGVVISGDQIETIVEILRQIAWRPQEFADQNYHPRAEVIARYERRELTRQLVKTFEEIAP